MMMRRSLYLVPFLIQLTIFSRAQGNTNADSPHILAIHATRLIDVRARETMSDAVILVDDGKIKAVGSKLAIQPELVGSNSAISRYYPVASCGNSGTA
jgi:hypothetical protein